MSGDLERLLLRLDWHVVRRLEGRLQGGFRTTSRGAGFDFAGLRAYTESDDARRIDWNATARLLEPQLREYTEDRELTAWLVLDLSASMATTPGRGKADLLTDLALALSQLLGRNGNRVGAVLYDAGSTRIVRPGTGRLHTLRLGRETERRLASPVRETTDLAAMLTAAAGVARRRSLVVVISDLIGVGDWQRPLMRLAQRHEVVAVRVSDPGDRALPEVGLVVVEDAETGDQLTVDASDPLFRQDFAAVIAEWDADLWEGTRRAGVPLHSIDTDQDLGDALVGMVRSTRWRRA